MLPYAVDRERIHVTQGNTCFPIATADSVPMGTKGVIR